MYDVRVSIDINDRIAYLFLEKRSQQGATGLMMRQLPEKLSLFSSGKRTVKP
jgi:hypothetical protein